MNDKLLNYMLKGGFWMSINKWLLGNFIPHWWEFEKKFFLTTKSS